MSNNSAPVCITCEIDFQCLKSFATDNLTKEEIHSTYNACLCEGDKRVDAYLD
ncbi:hypothetical protein HK099_004219, partial [Clydaea vesicula]